MNNKPLKIKKRGEDGTKIISVRIKEETLRNLTEYLMSATIREMNL